MIVLSLSNYSHTRGTNSNTAVHAPTSAIRPARPPCPCAMALPLGGARGARPQPTHPPCAATRGHASPVPCVQKVLFGGAADSQSPAGWVCLMLMWPVRVTVNKSAGVERFVISPTMAAESAAGRCLSQPRLRTLAIPSLSLSVGFLSGWIASRSSHGGSFL